MKKIMLMPLWVGLFIAGACLGPLFSGQVPKDIQVKPPKVMKVAVINIGAVMENDDRIKKNRAELLEGNAELKAKIEKLQPNLNRGFVPSFPKAPVTTTTTTNCRITPVLIIDPDKHYSFKIADNLFPLDLPDGDLAKRQNDLETVYRELEKAAGKKHEDFMASWWTGFEDCVKKRAEAYGFHLVVASRDPSDKELSWLLPSVHRKMSATNDGRLVLAYGHGSVDLTHDVTATLARWRWDADKKKMSD